MYAAGDSDESFMSADPILVSVLLVLVLLSAVWFVAEFRGGRAVRVGLGIVVMVAVGFLTWSSTSLVNRLSYNAWYGGATGGLIRTSLEQVEDRQLERVLMIWRGLERQYRPTYENRGYMTSWWRRQWCGLRVGRR